jgi:glucose-6-phosphate 1-dehydrogenase
MQHTDTTQGARIEALHPTIFVIFGITGDLAARKLLPALIALYAKKKLPQRFAVIGFSRRSFTREEFRELIRSQLKVKPGEFREEDVKHFLDHMSYEQGNFDDANAYRRLAIRINEIDNRWGQCSNKLFHLSVPPSLYEGILTNLDASRLTESCADETGWTRVLIEKPFGRDLATARDLDKLLGKLFKEEQIFRIDHYLAKEALQNIIAFRFNNSLFEPIWRTGFVDKIHVKLFETLGMEGRGDSYDPIGALKDVGQNHMLMMLAAIAMDRPASFSAADIRNGRALVLKKLEVPGESAQRGCGTRGQYVGYASEPGVAKNTRTETYFRLKTVINNSRWKGVPIYLESGKAMSETKTEIDVYFKPAKKGAGADEQNIMTFRIQPDEGIKIKFFVKTPGYEFKTEPKTLKFKYAEQGAPEWTGAAARLTDYERLIHDAFVGDQTLFASTDEIMASWKFIANVEKVWNKIPLVTYQKGAKEV